MKSAKTCAQLIMLSSFLLICAGCNAVYFYETEKASLTLEARPDPTSPISGSFGIKQRIATVVPPSSSSTQPASDAVAASYLAEASQHSQNAKDHYARAEQALKNPKTTDLATARAAARHEEQAAQRERALAAVANAHATGEALSIMSLFRFHKYPVSTGSVVPRVTIDAALVTGNAARQAIGDDNVNTVMLSLSADGAGSAEMTSAAIAQVYDGLKEIASQHPQSAAAQRVAALDALAQDLPATYPVDIYVNATTGPHQHALQIQKAKGSSVPHADFLAVLTYESDLNKTSMALTSAAQNAAIIASANPNNEDQKLPPVSSGAPSASIIPTDAAMVADGLKKQADQVSKLLDQHRQHFLSDPAIKSAINTFFGITTGGANG